MKFTIQIPVNHLFSFSNQTQRWQKHQISCQFINNFSSATFSKTKNMKVAVGSLSSINPRTAFSAYVETCISLLKSCLNQGLIKEGRTFHGHFIKMGISSDKYVSVKLLIMYLNCKKSDEVEELVKNFGGFDLAAWNCMINAYLQDGKLEEARLLFDEMPERNAVTWSTIIAGFMRQGRVDESISYFKRNPFQNVVLWTTMISGFIQNGLSLEALKLFHEMLGVGIEPNAITFTCVVKACVGLMEFGFGKCVLSLIVKYGLESNLSVCNSLITLHLKMGEVELSRKIFDRMEERDVVSWTAILDVYVDMGELTEARRIFNEMPERNEVSWSAMITRYSQNGNAEEAVKLFHQMVLEGSKPNVSCFSSILSAVANLADLPLGMNIHGHLIKLGLEKDVFVGSSLIDMYCKCGKTEDGQRAFNSILQRNVVTWNSMVSGYSLNGQLEEARDLFDQIPKRNTVSWNTMIAGYVQSEQCDKVLEVFDEMLLSGGIPDGSTFSTVLRACASLASLERGKNVHGKIVKLGIQNEVFMGTALTDMYAKSGEIASSRQVFNAMHEKNEISWTAMIQGLAENGFAEESLVLFEEMEKTSVVPPTELVFLAVLFACSHCGLVDKGFQYFERMETVYGIKPRGRHYTCMVDLLARSGRLSKAEEFIETMPFQPEANAWAALLNGCSIYKNDEIAERTAKKLWELADENSAGYVLLSNIYAAAGRWNDVSKVRKLMREKRLKKTGGCSWIEVRNQVHSFYCEDGCHAQSDEVYRVLELLIYEMTVILSPCNHF